MPVSVVLPNFNHGKWLPISLSALLRQDPPPSEIIIVDDGSTDDSIAVIEGFTRAHATVRLIRHPRNRGVIAAMNTGLEAASGDLVLFAAADDIVLPGLFARALAALRTYPQAAFYCSELVMIDQRSRVLGLRPFMVPSWRGRYLSAGEVQKGLGESDNWFTGPSAIYRRQLLADLGGLDDSLAALSDGLTARLLAVRHGFYFDAEVMAAWRVYPQSVSASSALSDRECRRLIDLAGERIHALFPREFGDRYAALFARRLRFNMARLRLVWGSPPENIRAAADLVGCNAWETTLLSALARVPWLGRHAVLGWFALRTAPFAIRAVLSGFWRHVTVGRRRRAALQQLVGAHSGDAV